MFTLIRTRAARGTAVAAATLTLGLALSGCGLLNGGGADRDPSGAVTAAQTADVFSVKVGDCMDDPGSGNISSIPAVPCGQPHDFEAYAETSMPSGDYPGQTAINDKSDEFCAAQFKTFIGIDPESSTLGFTSLTPTSSSWKSGDRLITCLVGEQGKKTTGSLKGTAR
ncbi:septum formation family protein [Psychromicrobium xiongbiense]|uniref:septum formation family protein n=1 Tax=Psychromicrobium xiongbiense TaxID=3051184 RepID=UPI002554E423|nr:septum formation family protein [Psychromicrobium sp. YIM S02556]